MALQRANKATQMSKNFKFEKSGDTLKGYYQGQVTKTINGSPAIEHTYLTSEGLVSVLGQANILQQYKNNGVTPGTFVVIKFSGQAMKLKGGRTMKVYDVDFDLEDTQIDGEGSTMTLENSSSEWEAADDESESVDESQHHPVPTKPTNPAVAPSVAQQARVQALLNRAKTKTA